MVYKKIGPIEIMGDNQSRVPFSTSLIITGKEDSTLIDCGAGKKTFEYIRQEHNVKKIYLTHHHMDHIWGHNCFLKPKSLLTDMI